LIPELLHLIETAFLTFIGVLGGIYALRTLKLLYRNPEMLKSQRIIWVPILIAGGFFTLSGALHLVEHFFSLIPELNLLSEFFLLLGLSLLALSIFRYWRLQKEYDETKQEGLRKIRSPKNTP